MITNSRQVFTLDEFEADKSPGVFYHIKNEEFQTQGVMIRCAGCGLESYLPLDPPHGWKLEQENPLTLSPSVFHTKERGGCGWHGWLRHGVWESC